jgi:hypothetical protein
MPGIDSGPTAVGYSIYANMLRHDSYGDPVTPFFRALLSFSEAKRHRQKAAKAKSLGLPRAGHHEDMAKLRRRQGLRRLHDSQKILRKAEKLVPKLERDCGEIATEQREEIMGDCDLMLRDTLFESNLRPELCELMWTEYQGLRADFIGRGRQGLAGWGCTKLDELIAEHEREDERVRGNPVPIIEIIAIAVALGFAIGAAIECFQKHECRWIEEFFSRIECTAIIAAGAPREIWPQRCQQLYPDPQATIPR